MFRDTDYSQSSSSDDYSTSDFTSDLDQNESDNNQNIILNQYVQVNKGLLILLNLPMQLTQLTTIYPFTFICYMNVGLIIIQQNSMHLNSPLIWHTIVANIIICSNNRKYYWDSKSFVRYNKSIKNTLDMLVKCNRLNAFEVLI